MHHILLVEDEAVLADTLRDVLETQGYHVSVATHGEQALDFLSKQVPDLIIADIMMPNLNGIDLIQVVKENTNWQGIPFFFLTAKTEKKDARIGYKYGADAYITKPFDISELLMRIRNAVSLKSAIERKAQEAVVPEEAPTVQGFEAQLRDFLSQHYDNPLLEVGHLAEHFQLGESGIQKKIKRLTNKTVRQYIREYRLEQAYRLLCIPGAGIAQVAHQVGFRSLPYFSDSFKNFYGYPPSQLLK